jgi:PP-loop superfamily ATP-utilizing enzyme
MVRAMDCRDEIARVLKTIGFDYVALDLEGFRSGSMNEGSLKEVLWTFRK